MKSVLVTAAGATPPAELREWLEQGSTSVDVITSSELNTFVSAEALGVDRIVFWTSDSNKDVQTLATTYASAQTGAAKPTDVLYVSTRTAGPPPGGVGSDQTFMWPDDNDKLRLILTVGNG
jgi:hypothetical protein